MSRSVTITTTDESETARIAARVGAEVSTGDCILLNGSIGAGKSVFCRALIRSLCGQGTEVPSPSFTLVQPYDTPAGTLWHCDLYRLSDSQELIELGLDEAFQDAICLIEWADRLGELTPKNALHITMEAQDTTHKIVLNDPDEHWGRLLEELHAAI